MNSPTPVPPVLPGAAIPWYKSPQTIGLITTAIAAAVALFPKAGQLLGLTSPTAISDAVQNIAGIVALLAPVIGTIVRSRSTVQPITLTQGNADVHPATIAAERAAAVGNPVFPSPGASHAPPPPPPPPHVSFTDPGPKP